MRSGKKWLIGLLGGVALLGGGALILVAYIPTYILSEVESQAEAAGAKLHDCQLEWSSQAVTLTGCGFELTDGAAQGTLGTVIIKLKDWQAAGVEVTTAAVEVLTLHGPDAVSKLNAVDHATAALSDVPLPLRLTGGSVIFSPETGLEGLRLSDVLVDSTQAIINARVDLPMGITGTIRLSRKGNDLALKGPLPDSWLSANVQITPNQAALVAAELKGFRIAWLLPLFEKPPSPEVSKIRVDAQAHLRVPLQLTKESITGDLRASAFGARLPVPQAVRSLVETTEMTLSSDVELKSNGQDFEATNIRVQAGALKLTGAGSLTWGQQQAPFRAKLTGGLSCGAVVEAAAHTVDNPELAVAAARILRRALKGQVGLVVTASGDARDLEAAELVRSVVPGCGFKEEVLEGVEGLLADLAANLPPPPPLLKDALSKAPKLSDLGKIQLPKFPTFPLPKRRVVDAPAPDPSAPHAAPQPSGKKVP